MTIQIVVRPSISIMYEMYPDAWPTTIDQRQHTGTDDKPRRRVRKEHSVMPRAISQSDALGQFAPQSLAPPR